MVESTNILNYKQKELMKKIKENKKKIIGVLLMLPFPVLIGRATVMFLIAEEFLLEVVIFLVLTIMLFAGVIIFEE